MKVLEIDTPPNKLNRRFILDGVYGNGLPRTFVRGGAAKDVLADAVMNVSNKIETVWFISDMLTVSLSKGEEWSPVLEKEVSQAVALNTPSSKKVFMLKKC